MSKKFIRYWFSALPFITALKVLVAYLFTKLFKNFNFHFSQTGEDVILSALLRKEGGFYIDVGCNEPIGKSNIFFLYLKGWKGITIDANEELIKQHKKIRKKDKSICAAVSNTFKEVTFYKTGGSGAVSTISEEFYNANKARYNYSETQTVHTQTLTSILDKNTSPDVSIDLLSVDVEGIDLEVLQGLNFEKYRPGLIVVETHGFEIDNKEQHPVYQLLKRNNYRLLNFATMNAYFIDDKKEHD